MFWKVILWLLFALIVAMLLGFPFLWLRPLYWWFFQPPGTVIAVICYGIGLLWPIYLRSIWKDLTRPNA